MPTSNTSTLPLVTQEAYDPVSAEFAADRNLIEDAYDRLTQEQPYLTQQVAAYMQQRAPSPDEYQFMREIYVLSYLLLEAQSDIDRLHAGAAAQPTIIRPSQR